MLFQKSSKALSVADAYISGFLGHYSLDCTAHPYVYAFTNYDPKNKKKNTEYFGQHAYLGTALDKELLWIKKQMSPSEFHQDSTIHLSKFQKHIIAKMLSYAYNHTYYDIVANPIIIRHAMGWMEAGTRAVNDSTGQKKVMVRFAERLTLHRAFISPMLPSDHYQFVEDPMNMQHRTWQHPWTKEKTSASFMELYKKAGRLFDLRLHNYYQLVANGFTLQGRHDFCTKYFGNRSFLSGESLYTK